MQRNAPSHMATTIMTKKEKKKKDIQVDAAKRALPYGEDNHDKKRNLESPFCTEALRYCAHCVGCTEIRTYIKTKCTFTFM